MKEYQMYEPLKKFLINNGVEGDFYAEVPANGCRADAVLKQNKIITVFEMKTTFNFKVIEQAFNWKGLANYVYIVVPKWEHNFFVRDLFNQYGLGLIVCNPETHIFYTAIKPKLFRKIGLKWENILQDEMKRNVAGTTGSSILTPYKITIERVRDYLKFRRELSMDEILDNIQTHYANPQQGLYNALSNYEKDWCEKFKKNGKTYFRFRNN